MCSRYSALAIRGVAIKPSAEIVRRRLEAVGLHDGVRDRWPNERVFTSWDYRAGMFHQDLGMRIDRALR